MRKIIVSNLISLDGFFEGVNKEIDWFTVDESFFEYARQLLNEVDTILFGRTTYQMMAAFWPNAINEDAVITHKMNHLNKVIFSKTLKKVEWNNAKLVKDNLAKEVKKMKEQSGKDIVIFGSGTLVTQLTQLGLIDEYRTIINPLLLGKGNPMFKGIDEKINLKLLKVKTLDSGVVILYYVPGKK
ncbi:MAG TPA: dihydrofolate reductase family protein [Hanamia sp.]|nr:dihydrofolate reductase family protein [Hanamia sp.]